MSDEWFSAKLAPDGDVEDGCHPEEAEALKDYLRGRKSATDAARAMTRPVSTAKNPKDDLPRFYVLLLDALVELSSEHIERLLELIQAIENLPEPDFSGIESSKRPDEQLWKGLPHFANHWYDVGYRSGGWKMDAEAASGQKRDALRDEHVRRAEIEARLVLAGLAGIPIGWGYEVVVDALESDEALLDFEVPAAAEWVVACGQRFLQGAERGEKSYALKDEGMSLEQWSVWEQQLRKLQEQSGVVQRAATKAIDAMHRVKRGQS
jgi:hypothetical protein